MVREAINTMTPSTELAAVKPVNTPTDWNSVADKDRLVSTQQISYKAPDREMELTFERSANAVSTRRPTDMHFTVCIILTVVLLTATLALVRNSWLV